MNADVFTRRWLGLFALLAGLIAIAPYFVDVVVANSGCGEASRCADAHEVLALYGRRLTLVVILVPLAVAIAARALTIGAFLWAFPFALLMVAGALPLMFETEQFAAMTNWTEVLAVPALIPLLFLVLLLVALSAYPDDREGGTARAWRAVLGLIAIATLFVTAPAWLNGVATLPYAGEFAVPVAHALASAHAALGITEQLAQLGNYCLIAFILCAAGLVVSREGNGTRTRAIRA